MIQKEIGSIIVERFLLVFMLNNNVRGKNSRTNDDLK